MEELKELEELHNKMIENGYGKHGIEEWKHLHSVENRIRELKGDLKCQTMKL